MYKPANKFGVFRSRDNKYDSDSSSSSAESTRFPPPAASVQLAKSTYSEIQEYNAPQGEVPQDDGIKKVKDWLENFTVGEGNKAKIATEQSPSKEQKHSTFHVPLPPLPVPTLHHETLSLKESSSSSDSLPANEDAEVKSVADGDGHDHVHKAADDKDADPSEQYAASRRAALAALIEDALSTHMGDQDALQKCVGEVRYSPPPKRRSENEVMLRGTSHGLIVEEGNETGEFVLLDDAVADDDTIAANKALLEKYKGKKPAQRGGPPIKTLSEAKNGATGKDDPRKRKPLTRRVMNFWEGRKQREEYEKYQKFGITPEEAKVILDKEPLSTPEKSSRHKKQPSTDSQIVGPASLYEQVKYKMGKREREEEALEEASIQDVKGSEADAEVTMIDDEDGESVLVESVVTEKLNPFEAQEADVREYELYRAALTRISKETQKRS